MQTGPGPSQEGTNAPGPTMNDPEGQAAFLDEVRTLVHGERIHPQRADSDAWTAPGTPVGLPVDAKGGPTVEPAPLTPDPEPAAGGEGPGDWLPGRWEPQPKRRRAVPEKSAKSYRGRRRRRTVEQSALEGAPGTEVRVAGTPRAPEIEPPGSSPSSGRSIEESRPAEPAPAPELEYAPEPPLSDPRKSRRREAKLSRAAAKAEAARESSAAKDRVVADRKAAKARADLERAEARIARAEQASDRRAAKIATAAARAEAKATARSEATAAKAQARAEREETRRAQAEVTAKQKAESLVAAAERASAQRQAKAEAQAAKAKAKAGRQATKAQARADRQAAKARTRVDREVNRRTEAEAAARRKAERVVAAAERKVAKRQAAVERRAAKAQARADRRAAKVRARVGRADRTDQAPGLSRRERRRERRREAALAKAVAAARVGGSTDARDEARARRESLEDFLVRVEAPRLPEREPRTPRWVRRTVSVSVVGTLVVGGAVLPWAAPDVRDWLAGLVPDRGTEVVRVADPPVAPSTEAFIGPVGIAQQAGSLAGVRLEAAGPPREVRIPRLDVDSEVVPISGQSGTLLPPDDPQVLGWWREGKPVGAQYGTSVVTGHAVHSGGGALDQLGELVAGDSLRVRTDAGWIRYVVQRTRIYSKGALADDAEEIFRLGGPGRLVLISCDDWNGEIFESNAVVYATPAADLPFDAEVPDGGPDGVG